jgi:hypothetical protein
MKKSYRPSPHIRYCHVDDGLVLLDLKTENYGTLPFAQSQIFLDAVREPSLSEAAAQLIDAPADNTSELKALIDAGLLVEVTDERLLSEAAPPIPTDSVLDSFDRMLGKSHELTHVPAFVCSVAEAALALKCLPFEQLVRRLMAKKETISNTSRDLQDDELLELLISFQRLRIWTYSSFNRCLFDSLAQFLFLLRRNVPSSLVLGVQTKPFAAHAWVQRGHVVLNDTLEKVRRFTPILAI